MPEENRVRVNQPRGADMFCNVRLYTAQGELVTAVESPTYLVRPDALHWGSRYFVWRDDVMQYREMYVVPIVPATGLAPPRNVDDVQRP